MQMEMEIRTLTQIPAVGTIPGERTIQAAHPILLRDWASVPTSAVTVRAGAPGP